MNRIRNVNTPAGMPDVAVSVTHVEPGPDGAVPRVGSAVGAGRTVLGRVRDMSRVENPAIARYTNDELGDDSLPDDEDAVPARLDRGATIAEGDAR